MKGGCVLPVAPQSSPLRIMADFEGIPALGDSCVDEVEEMEEIESGEESDGCSDTGGKYRFNGKHIYVTWSKSKVESKDEFHEKLVTMMPSGVRMFGGRELHQDGTPHYHVVFSFAEKVHWADAAKRFSIEGDYECHSVREVEAGTAPFRFLGEYHGVLCQGRRHVRREVVA